MGCRWCYALLPGICLAWSVLAERLDQPRREPIQPIPASVALNPDKVALGERLFNDPRLSRDGNLACARCHPLDSGGADGLPRSVTNSGQPDLVNATTVFNSGLRPRLTWRGAFDSLEAQAEADLRNPRHAATDWPRLLPKLEADAGYKQAFARRYRDGINRANVLDAIATFERSLITPNARFDRYLRGDAGAISARERLGYQRFKLYGCTACHQGVNVGGNLFQRIGVFADYFELRGAPITQGDLGRYQVTGQEADRHVFRVPSLRNVAVTAPYFHDGNVATLGEAVRLMGRLQLGRELPDEDVRLIVAFLHTLTGEYKGKPLRGGGTP